MNAGDAIDQRDLEAYLRGSADEETVQRVERALLADDALFARLQSEDLFQRGMRAASLDESEFGEAAGGAGRWSRWLLRPAPAAIGALAVAVVALGAHSWRLERQLEQLRAPAGGVEVVTLYDRRSLLPGMDGPPTALPDTGRPALLEIDVSAYQRSAYSLELQYVSRKRRLERVMPDERGYLTVYVPDPAGIRTIAVHAADGELLRAYSFDPDPAAAR